MALTDLRVRSARPESKVIRLYDERGMYLEVTPQGSKLWRLKYRFGGKEKRLALGQYPEVSLKEARERRDKARDLLRDSIDPSDHRKLTRTAQNTTGNGFEVVAREWLAKNAPTWADSHSVKIIQRLERDIFPWLGARPIGEISAPELLSVLRRIEQRGAVETAHRARQNCSCIFRYAIATCRAEKDPAADLRGALGKYKTANFAAVTDPDRLGEILLTLESHRGSLPVRAAIRLVPLLFVRPIELRMAEWQEIDFENAEWRYIVTKTDTEHIVPLATQAIDILRELYPLTGRGRYVFPCGRNPRGDKPMSENAVLAGMRRLGISKDETTGHGFRATARTLLDEILGFRPDIIEHQLAHAVRDPNGRAYNRTAHLPERKRMMQAWADYLDDLKANAQQKPGDVGKPPLDHGVSFA